MNRMNLFNHKKIGHLLLASAVALSTASIPFSTANANEAAAVVQKQTNLKTAKPVWQKTVGKPNSTQIGSTFENGRIYYKAGVYLAAANLKTGKAVWTYKSTPSSEPLVHSGYVYYTDTAGRIHKVNAKTGKGVWTSKVYATPEKGTAYEPKSIGYFDGMLIIGDGYGLTAYDIKSGKLKWKSESKGESGYKIEAVDGLILASSTVSGAITTNQLYAISAYTGQVKWTYEGDYQNVLSFRDGNLYISRNNNGIDDGYALTIDILEYATGKLVKTLEYQPVEFVENQASKMVEAAGGNYYFAQNTPEGGGQLAIVPVDASNHSAAVKTYKYDAEISRFDILNNTIAIGLADGRMILKNLKTGQDVAVYKLGSGNFIETHLTIDDELIMQTGGKIYFAPLPASLKS